MFYPVYINTNMRTREMSLSDTHTRLCSETYLPLLDVVPEVFELFEPQFARAVALHDVITVQYTVIRVRVPSTH